MKHSISSCFAIIIAFIIGFILGMWAHASRNTLTPSDIAVCDNGAQPDKHGCCPGEIYTDMNDLGFNCCPESGGDCFPPLR
ncbi:MAG: hypothetical protein IJD69_03180 [Alphaproteobacteria bacterium]|nr:hypothetical protein [Alphaproteobacteria bacterium]MBQ4130353.1 hypothetical protein [Alphaproteobacteria bacterium]MBQ8042275.1 hypothetical protein [Alphaproteobacteria bacterium]MBQ8728908.1 hypothetical protein [Alphaproteobacteria bacterium]MBR5566983.1 hypothetical protein [Alphaproteobacteria bacterium]